MAWRGPAKTSTNPVPNKVQAGPNISDLPNDVRREMQKRRDDDVEKTFSVTLMDIDETIFNHLDKNINVTLTDNGETIKVPVIFSNPERWVAIRKEGFVRDKNGKVQRPIVALKRTTTARNDQLMTFNRYLTYPVIQQNNINNPYDKFSVLSGGQRPTYNVYGVTLPDHVTITYEFMAWTDKIEQMNKIIEQINFATEDYWGDKQRFRFRTSISDYNHQIEVVADQDRIIRTSFTLTVYAYLLPEVYENRQSTMQKFLTPRRLIVNSEVVVTMPPTNFSPTPFNKGRYTGTPYEQRTRNTNDEPNTSLSKFEPKK
jgi:hypothetical protein